MAFKVRLELITKGMSVCGKRTALGYLNLKEFREPKKKPPVGRKKTRRVWHPNEKVSGRRE